MQDAADVTFFEMDLGNGARVQCVHDHVTDKKFSLIPHSGTPAGKTRDLLVRWVCDVRAKAAKQ